MERPDDLAFTGGGAGLWSTLDDYLNMVTLEQLSRGIGLDVFSAIVRFQQDARTAPR